MSENLTAMPSEISAGTSLSYTREYADYPASAYTLTLYLNGINSKKAVEATGSDAIFTVAMLPSDTAAITPGLYHWVERISATGFAKDAASGVVIINPNIATAANGAMQSSAERTLAVIEAAIEGRLTTDMQSYQIDGRQITKIPILELTRLRGIYASRVDRQNNSGKSQTVEVWMP